MSEVTITRAIYDAFQHADFAGWDDIIARNASDGGPNRAPSSKIC